MREPWWTLAAVRQFRMIEGPFARLGDFPALGLAHPAGAGTAVGGGIDAKVARVDGRVRPQGPQAHRPHGAVFHALLVSAPRRSGWFLHDVSGLPSVVIG